MTENSEPPLSPISIATFSIKEFKNLMQLSPIWDVVVRDDVFRLSEALISGRTVYLSSLGIGEQCAENLLRLESKVMCPTICVGYCGALNSKFKVGDLVEPRSFQYSDGPLEVEDLRPRSLTMPDLIRTPEEKAKLFDELGCDIVDMESFFVRRTRVIRVVLDEASDNLPDFVVSSTGVHTSEKGSETDKFMKILKERMQIANRRLIDRLLSLIKEE